MAKKFLPFISDDTDKRDLFNAVKGYTGENVHPKELASLFYIVSRYSPSTVRSFISDNVSKSADEDDTINAILENFSSVTVSSSCLQLMLRAGKYFKQDNYEKSDDFLSTLSEAEAMVFLYVCYLIDPKTLYSSLYLEVFTDSETQVSVLSDIRKYVNFNDMYFEQTFSSSSDLCSFILYHAANGSEKPAPSICPTFIQ